MSDIIIEYCIKLLTVMKKQISNKNEVQTDTSDDFCLHGERRYRQDDRLNKEK